MGGSLGIAVRGCHTWSEMPALLGKVFGACLADDQPPLRGEETQPLPAKLANAISHIGRSEGSTLESGGVYPRIRR
jgi:hypothetical protein